MYKLSLNIIDNVNVLQLLIIVIFFWNALLLAVYTDRNTTQYDTFNNIFICKY